MVSVQVSRQGDQSDALLQLDLVKSPLAANPCMNSREKLYLHGHDRVYINIGDGPASASSSSAAPPAAAAAATAFTSAGAEAPTGPSSTEALLSSKQWLVIQVSFCLSSSSIWWPFL